jgi:CBS domain containing-hemolysin-like protein
MPLGRIAAAAAALAISSLFTTGGAALTALPEAHLHALVAGDSRSAGRFRRYAGMRGRVRARWLVARVLGVGMSTVVIAQAIAEWLDSPGYGVLAAALSAVLVYGVCTEALGIVARRRPEMVSDWALHYLRPFEWLVWPVGDLLARVGTLVDRRIPHRATHDPGLTETEVEWAVREGERHGAIANEPAEMIRNVLDFRNTVVRDVMVPRRHLTGVAVGAKLSEILEIVANEGHSRFPVYRDNLDNVVGLLYVKDLFRVVQRGELASARVEDIVRHETLFATETQSAASILREMRAHHQQMVVVVDEFGGTSGVVTLEDLLEEIVGEIEDEYDADAEAPVQSLGGGRYVARAAVSIDDLSAFLGKQIPADGAFESLGGLLAHRAGRVPPVGTVIHVAGFRFTVREADETHVERVDIDTVDPPARQGQPR